MPEREPTAAHFRIVMPAGLKGTKHAANSAQIYVTLPGLSEVMFPAVVSVDGHWGVDGATELTLQVIGSIEVEYS